MLIGEFCETYPPTLDGVGRVMLSYCQSLTALGHTALYIAPNNPLYPEQVNCTTLLYDGIRVPGEPYRIGIPMLSKSYRNATSHMKFDIVHAHSPFLGGREALRLSKRDGAPLIATFHSKFYDDFYKATGSKILAQMGVNYVVDFFNVCDEVWAVNGKTADVLKEYGYKGEIVTMPNGTNLQDLSEADRLNTAKRYPLRDGVPTLIFAGQQNKKKNIESILLACASLKNRGFDFQFVMIGAGPDAAYLRTMAHDLGIDGYVLFTGFLSHRPTVMALYERSDLMVFPSIYDNAPMVVREAAAMGTPALLIEGSCSSEGIIHGENGYLCENKVEAITEAILAALPTAHEVGERARETIPIPWDKLMTQVVARYEALMARKNKGRL